MNRDELQQAVIEAIQTVAPEVEGDEIDADEALREECDLDSMDFLHFLEALKKSTTISVPEADYGKVGTLNKLLDYLELAGNA